LSPSHAALPDGASKRARTAGLWGRISRTVGGLLILFWMPSALFLVSLLMAQHLLTLPKPRMDAGLRQGLEPALLLHKGSWFALHVLAENCQCSQEILDHLVARGSDARFSEKVLFIGNAEPTRTRLLARGFAFEAVTPEELQARYGLEGAPLLLVVNRQSEVAYSGGYSSTSRGFPQDVAILRALERGTAVNELPLFGCAVSRALQRQLDPLGLKYPVTGSVR
jgi:hypothetical protein